MGAGNAKAAFATWRHVPDPAFRVLAYMALVSLDTDHPPRFWGGREALALSMGRDAPHTEADYRAVSRAIRQLIDAGALRLERGPSPVSNARYELQLLPVTGDAPRPVNGGRPASGEQATPGDGNAGRPVTEQATPGDGTVDAPRPAEEEQDSPRLNSGPSARHPAQPSVGASSPGLDGVHEYEDDQTENHDCAVCTYPRRHPSHRTAVA